MNARLAVAARMRAGQMPTAQQVLDLLIESGEPASAAHELASEYGNALAAEVAADHHHQADDFVGSLRAFDLH